MQNAGTCILTFCILYSFQRENISLSPKSPYLLFLHKYYPPQSTCVKHNFPPPAAPPFIGGGVYSIYLLNISCRYTGYENLFFGPARTGHKSVRPEGRPTGRSRQALRRQRSVDQETSTAAKRNRLSGSQAAWRRPTARVRQRGTEEVEGVGRAEP